jgi:DNA-binding beta-propeller fold protein YncE
MIWSVFMKRNVLLLIAIIIALCLFTSVRADIEWSVINRIALEDNPRDIAISPDGTTVYILCEKRILLYSTQQNKVTDTIPLTDSFSQIALSPEGEKLLVTDTEKKQLSIIQISQVYDIGVGQSPIIGKVDAPVSVFAFLDYQ